MRVLHIGKYFHPHAGGMENYLGDLMVEQVRSDIDARALVHESRLSLRGTTEELTLRGVRLRVTRAALWARLLFTPISPGFPLLAWRLLREQDPDILHIHLPNVSAFWLLLLPLARRAKWVIHWHSDVVTSQSQPALRIFYQLYRPFERALLKRAARVIVTSDAYLRASTALAKWSNRCVTVPLGLDPERLVQPVAGSAAASHVDQLRVLAVGRLTYYKGFSTLLSAASQYPHCEIHLVGSGDEAVSLAVRTQTLGLEDRVTFHGALDDNALAAQYAACDVLCLPSIERTEAFGVVLLEAMYFSRACVVSRLSGSGMSWVVEDGVTGLHFDPGNASELAGLLQRLREDPALMRALGAAGRRRFNACFHIEQSADAVARVYDQALASH